MFEGKVAHNRNLTKIDPPPDDCDGRMRNFIPKIRKLLLFLTVNVIVIILILAMCEGLASLILFLRTISRGATVAERIHTEYDQELGWVNLPNIAIDDIYGPGLALHTNTQGFRGQEDFTVAVPPGKLRLICPGDSFTLGYGVGDEQTWCQALAGLDERLQSVNMGQGGYGVGQAYLWYKRDGVKLDHDLHLFAFITTDFERMQQKTFLGYGKPRLTIRDNQLVVDNTPVPERAFAWPWLTQNRGAIQELRTVQLWRKIQAPEAGSALAEAPETDGPQADRIAAEILKDLLRLNAVKNSTLVLVYLPTLGDYEVVEQSSTERWRAFLEVASQDTGVAYIDVIEELRQLPADEVQSLFIPEGELDFPGAAGHYSVKGNQYVARILYERLLALPSISARLDKIQ